MEISATNGLLADITDLNDQLEIEKRRSGEVSTHEEDTSSHPEDISSHEEGMSSPVVDHEVQAETVPQVSSQQEELDVQSTPPQPGIHTAGGEMTGHFPGSHCTKQMDIRRFLMEGDHPETVIFKDMSQNT